MRRIFVRSFFARCMVASTGQFVIAPIAIDENGSDCGSIEARNSCSA
jgi:hypothetical protein